ncbi:hypothetical protein M426DRAFT_10969 [Hypoxylon sp. CI-4A]|nr:hypothetical protein M426DRAFT_10969 [Hypoxylon sp. CI-4A]
MSSESSNQGNQDYWGEEASGFGFLGARENGASYNVSKRAIDCINNVEYLLDTHPKPNQHKLFAEAAIDQTFFAGEMLRQIVLYQPYLSEPQHGELGPQASSASLSAGAQYELSGFSVFEPDELARFNHLQSLTNTIHESSVIDTSRLTPGPPIYEFSESAGNARSPIRKEFLEMFWAEADEVFKTKNKDGKTPIELFGDYITSRDIAAKGVSQIAGPIESNPPRFSQEHHVFVSHGESTARSEETAQIASSSTLNGDESSTQPSSFKPKSMEVIKAIFSTSLDETGPMVIKWEDFCSTMTQLAFEAQHIYGSSWVFKPLEDGGPYIKIDKPRGDIDLAGARRLGERLIRTYGWMAPLKDADEDAVSRLLQDLAALRISDEG